LNKVLICKKQIFSSTDFQKCLDSYVSKGTITPEKYSKIIQWLLTKDHRFIYEDTCFNNEQNLLVIKNKQWEYINCLYGKDKDHIGYIFYNKNYKIIGIKDFRILAM
jgi:hypothetical protein